MNLIRLILGSDEEKEFKEREKQIAEFRKEVVGELDRIAEVESTEMGKERAAAMRELVARAVIEGHPRAVLEASGSSLTLGANTRMLIVDPATKRRAFVGPNVISIPIGYIFGADNKLTERGKMVMLHEFAHTITPNEFTADRVAVRMGSLLRIPKRHIWGSIIGRRMVLGMDNFRRLAETVKGLRPRERKPLQRQRFA